MRTFVLVFGVVGLVAAPVFAAVSFFDNFEAGVHSPPWYNWTDGAVWPPPNPSGINNLLATSTSHNHTPGGTTSALAWKADPAAWNAYADFGATSDSIHVEAWLFEDYNNPGTNPAQPVTNMLSVYGDAANPGAFSDYIQLGVVAFYPSGSAGYGFRTAYNDAHGLGIINTGVSRKAGWTKLSFDVDSVASGGQVRFYIDDNPVGTSHRSDSGVNERWVRLGNNSKSYENFWYDDVKVVPEPASLCLLALGGLAVLRRRSAR
jgi:hypothetical protein